MLEGGESAEYVARRLLRVASEDVGLADPHALPQVSLLLPPLLCVCMYVCMCVCVRACVSTCGQACPMIGRDSLSVCVCMCVTGGSSNADGKGHRHA